MGKTTLRRMIKDGQDEGSRMPSVLNIREHAVQGVGPCDHNDHDHQGHARPLIPPPVYAIIAERVRTPGSAGAGKESMRGRHAHDIEQD